MHLHWDTQAAVRDGCRRGRPGGAIAAGVDPSPPPPPPLLSPARYLTPTRSHSCAALRYLDEELAAAQNAADPAPPVKEVAGPVADASGSDDRVQARTQCAFDS